MLSSFEQLRRKIVELARAVEAERDEDVARLDREISPLVEALLTAKPQSGQEGLNQIGALCELLLQSNGDTACVRRVIAKMHEITDDLARAQKIEDRSGRLRLEGDERHDLAGALLCEYLPDSICVIDMDGWILHSNANFRERFGGRRQDHFSALERLQFAGPAGLLEEIEFELGLMGDRRVNEVFFKARHSAHYSIVPMQKSQAMANALMIVIPIDRSDMARREAAA